LVLIGDKMDKLRIASRGSKLALCQCNMVSEILKEHGVESEIIVVKTKGDKDQVSPLTKIGGDGLFVKEIERCLLNNEADIAVHCGKDLPYKLLPGLMIGGVPIAATANDCLITRRGEDLNGTPIIGTSSPRRTSECLKIFPYAKIVPIRGNIDTRLRKLKDGQYDAIIMAVAGLERMQPSMEDFDVRPFSIDEMIPAPCQGILAIECREGNHDIISLLEKITDKNARRRFEIERDIFCALNADCSVAVGVYCELKEELARVWAFYQNTRIEHTFRESELFQISDYIKKKLLGEEQNE